jgi:hypothetical protein
MRPEQRRHATRAVKGWGRSRARKPSTQSNPRAGGTVGGTMSEEALATGRHGGSPAVTGPARQAAPVQQSFF